MPLALTKQTAASVTTPPSGKVTIFVDSVTGQPYYKDSAGVSVPLGGSTAWGDITGTLSDQTDLQSSLDAKLDDSQATAFGLSLLGDANAAAGRSTLGLGTLATQNGTFSGTSSGTNTGDQTITLTGDVTGSGTGSFATTLVTNQPAVHTWALAQTFTVAPVFTDASGTRTALGATTIGANLLTLANPSAVTFPRFNADNTVTARTAAQLLSDIGAAAAPFDDGTAIIKGSADATKLLRFEVDGFTTATTRVLTPPNADGTIAVLGLAQSFTAAQTFDSATASSAQPQVKMGSTGYGLSVFNSGTDGLLFGNNASFWFYCNQTRFTLTPAQGMGWTSGTANATGTPDAAFSRNAAGIVEVNNGTAGTFRDLKLRNLLTAGGNGSYVQTPSMTVANLAAAATAGAGARAFVTDATATTFLSTVSGGGANKVPVVSDGTNWLIG